MAEAGLDEADSERVGFVLTNLVGALAPSNNPLLIQYRPSTAEVRQVPLVIVPPVINKFYVMDLAPGRSMVEYAQAVADADLPAELRRRYLESGFAR